MITRAIAAIACVLVVTAPAIADSHRTMAPKDAEVYFISPQDGATVSSPVAIRFGVKGMGLAPAGVEKEKTGHHHLIIDAKLPNLDEPIPKDNNYRHFGGGQTETSVDLKSGKRTLQLLLGDHNHIPHEPPVKSNVITITVE
ncbi:MAG: DUF4399 domain-containing protein [Hyphomicrobiales bacterium]|nr:DUF4399 domain-containing protein [Hyphomicrobiales bacterium]